MCRNSQGNLEAPPGFEPGMEVLQTSALPLGDGAGRNWGSKLTWNVRPRLLTRPTTTSRRSEGTKHHCERAGATQGPRRFLAGSRNGVADEAATQWSDPGGPTGSDVSILERETGFEPATSTLARSHSTTELFPRLRARGRATGRARPLSRSSNRTIPPTTQQTQLTSQ